MTFFTAPAWETTAGGLTPNAPGRAEFNLTQQERIEITGRFFGTEAKKREQTKQNRAKDGYNYAEHAVGFLAATAINLVDDVWGNRLIPGTDKGDVWDTVGTFGMVGESLKSYYENNEGAIGVSSGLVGTVGVGYLTAVKALPWVAGRLAGSAAVTGTKVWQYGANLNAATRAAVVNKNLAAATEQTYATAWTSAAHRSLIGLETGKLAAVAAAEEAAITIVMNANDLIYEPENQANNLFWAAFGIGLGGTFGAIHGRAMLRHMANDETVIATRAAAQDRVGITRNSENKLPLALMETAESQLGASITRYAVQAKQADPNATGAMLSRIEAERSVSMNAAKQTLMKMGFAESTATHYIRTHLAKDPFTFHGLDEIKPKNGIGWISKMESEVQAAMKGDGFAREALDSNLNKLERAMVHVDGAWYPVSGKHELRTLMTAGEVQKPEVRALAKGLTEEIEVTLSGSKKVRLDSSRAPKELNDLNLTQRIQVAGAYSIVSKRLQSLKQAWTFPSKGDSHWLQVDAAIQHVKEGGQVVIPKEWQARGIMSVDDLPAESLRLKAKEILDNPDALHNAEDFIKYNLPTPTYLERVGDSAEEQIRSLLKAAKDGASRKELESLRSTMQTVEGYARQDRGDVALSGNLFNFNRDKKGAWVEPVVATFKDASHTQQNAIMNAITDNMVEHKMNRFAILTHNKDTFVGQFADRLIQSPALQKASQLHGAAADQVTGLSNTLTQLAGSTRTMEFRARDNDMMLGLVNLSDLKVRSSDDFLTSLTERHLGRTKESLAGPTARSSRQLLNQFHTYSGGWDLLESATTVNKAGDPDAFAFVLAPTERNAQRLGVEVEELEAGDTLLLNPRTGQPIILDKTAYEFQAGFDGLSRELLREKNIVREAMGLNPIKRRPWYVPPPSLKGKQVGFVLDANHNPVPNRTVVASSVEEYQRLSAALARDLEKEMPGARILTQDQIAAYKDVFDDAAMGWVDPRIIAAPGKSQTGGLSTEFMNLDSVQDTMNWIREQTEALGNAVQRTILDDQIRSARMRHDIEIQTGAAKGRTIYQEYEAIARGIPLSKLESSMTGEIARSMEKVGNSLLSTVWSMSKGVTPRQAGQIFDDLTQKMGVPEKEMPKLRGHAKDFKRLSDELGKYSPYKNFEDYLTQQGRQKMPLEVRQISQKLNAFSAAMLLRYEPIAQASMNLLGLITTMPSILRSGRAPISLVKAGKGDTAVPVLDVMRIMMGGVSDMVHERSGAVWDTMQRNGDATQAVAELHKQIAQLNDSGKYGQIMYGTGSANNKKGIKGFFHEKGIDGMLAVATDTSENWSRQYAHFVGLRLADMHGIKGEAAQHAFARDIANSSIANYSIVNRPEAYQSSFGSMVGLFQSWARAYNQRLFRWVEEKEYARLAEQFAIQTAMFGTGSNIGMDQLEWLYDKSIGGRDDEGKEVPTVTDRIYERFGSTAGMAVAQGGIAAFTGMSLWTRGDTNIRTPSLDPRETMPALNLLSKTTLIGMDFVKYGADADVVKESIGRNFPNRSLRGAWTEIMQGGAEIDASGRVITQSHTLGDSIARFAGIRSARAQQQAEIYYANSAAMRDDAARMEKLRTKTRAMLRSGKVGEEEWLNIFDAYVKIGGNPGNFRGWIQSQIKETKSPRDIRQLDRFMNNPNNHLRLWRHDTYMKGLY